MLSYADVPRSMNEALCCLCFPIKIGLWMICFVNICEEIFSIPEIFEINYFMYTFALLVSLIPGIWSIVYTLRWLTDDSKKTREDLITAFKLKWLEHAFDGTVHLIFLATLSEEDFFKKFRSSSDPYRHADYSGKYQMAAFFSAFIFGCLDLLIYAYFLNVAHVYQILSKDIDVTPAPRTVSEGYSEPILPQEEIHTEADQEAPAEVKVEMQA